MIESARAGIEELPEDVEASGLVEHRGGGGPARWQSELRTPTGGDCPAHERRCVGMGVRSCGEPLVKVPLRTSEEIATSLVQPGEQVSGDTQVVGGRRDLPVTQWRMIGLREEASAQMPGGELIEQPEVLCCRRYLGEMLADPSVEVGQTFIAPG
jgi:hypothetical protein